MDATEETQKICDDVKDQVEKKTGENYRVYTAAEYRTQHVKGRNFLIKVDVGEDYDHLSIYHKLPGEGGHKTKDDPLIPLKI